MSRTVKGIIDDLRFLHISYDQAVIELESLIEQTKNDCYGHMGKSERSHFIGIIKEYYRDYGYPLRGNYEEINNYLAAGLKRASFEELETIINSKENRLLIEDTLLNLREKLLG